MLSTHQHASMVIALAMANEDEVNLCKNDYNKSSSFTSCAASICDDRFTHKTTAKEAEAAKK
jgi:hypothetical protein